MNSWIVCEIDPCNIEEAQRGFHQHTRSEGGCHNIRRVSKTPLKLKSCKNLFIHNIRFSSQIILKFRTEHDGYTNIFCAKFHNDSDIEK